jgi:preprotein translocase subunit SecD
MNISTRKIALSGFTFWIVLLAVGLYFIYPFRKNIRLGIDLVGGTYITLGVKVEKAIESELLSRLNGIPVRLENVRKEQPKSKKIEDMAIVLTFDSSSAAHDAASILKTEYQDMQYTQHGNELRMVFTDAKAKMIKKEAIDRNIEVLRTRLNRMSVAEITIAPQGERNIIVELPDVSDPAQAKAMIGKAAILEFKLVAATGKTEDDILLNYDGVLPEGYEIVPDQYKDHGYYLVPRYTEITGASLRDAQGEFNQAENKMAVAFTFTPEGGEKFEELTGKNIGKPLGIILDGNMIVCATINAKINTRGTITGNYTPESAQELALLLKSGAFVAPVTFEEERQIGSTLGQESIHQGLVSCIVGLGLLFLFSIYYYSLCGLLAFITLIYNLFFTLLCLAWLKATLTLPGIAGMVLTIGMAIDASVLIYERIKEELAGGKTARKAVDEGFGDAMRVILDGNITTFIVGLVLYYFGTGPIQGFAVTMMLGVIATLVTGLFFLKSMFNVLLNNFNVQKLKI